MYYPNYPIYIQNPYTYNTYNPYFNISSYNLIQSQLDCCAEFEIAMLKAKIEQLQLQAAQQQQNMILMEKLNQGTNYVDTTVSGENISVTVRYSKPEDKYISETPKDHKKSIYEILFPDDPIQEWSKRMIQQIELKYAFLEELKKQRPDLIEKVYFE